MQNIFRENLLHELLETFRRFNVECDNLEKPFFEWITDNARTAMEKKLAFQMAQLNTFGKIPDDVNEMADY